MSQIVELQNLAPAFNVELKKKGFGSFARDGKKVTIEYTATLFNGKVVDDSERHGGVITTIGEANVTVCMDEALK